MIDWDFLRFILRVDVAELLEVGHRLSSFEIRHALGRGILCLEYDTSELFDLQFVN